MIIFFALAIGQACAGGMGPNTYNQKFSKSAGLQPKDNFTHKMHFAVASDWNRDGGYSSWTRATVIEKHKLVWCAIPKVGSSAQMKLQIRLMGMKLRPGVDCHAPKGYAKYLSQMPLEEVQKIMSDPEWTKVVFVRNPLSRTLSGYRDKLVTRNEFHRTPVANKLHKGGDNATRLSIPNFLALLSATGTNDNMVDEHWRRQSAFCGLRHFNYDFVGYQETMREDVERILRKMNLWDKYGATGWGPNGTEAFLASGKIGASGWGKKGVVTNSQDSVLKWFNPQTARQVVNFYAEDFLRFGYSTDTYLGLPLADRNSFGEKKKNQ